METHALQKALDEAIDTKCLLSDLRVKVKNIAVTVNLSLRRVLYSVRPLQENRIKKELVVIRDRMISEDTETRYVPGKFMVPDCLTKFTNPE